MTVPCNSTVYTERIFKFPLQKWLRERATIFYKYDASLLVAVNTGLLNYLKFIILAANV